MSIPSDSSRRPALLFIFTVVFAGATAAAYVLARRTGLVLFAALSGLDAFAAIAALGNVLPRLPFHLRTAIRAAGLLAVAAIPATFYLFPHTVHGGASDIALRLAAVTFAILAFGCHFLATYTSHVLRETPSAEVSALAPVARLLAAAHALVVATLLVRLYAERSWFHPVEVVFNIATAILIAEVLLQSIVRLYQPARLRDENAVFARSIVLPTVFGESGPLRSLAATTEKTSGVKLGETWLVQLLRFLTGPLLLAGIVGLWASTTVTRVPVDSRGVLVCNGAFAADSLAPGLHFHLPRPWARVQVIATERVQEIALGFERDLAGPVLWAEKHFEGEQNLLVGQGEELLTINVPIHYRIRDAVAYLRRTADPRLALEDLGYHELLALTNSHTSFGMMTTDRGEMTDKLRANLQAASDRLGLGLEIVFVGLKDVHPPVAVAPAYQDVISAEEERVAFVEQARTYSTQTLTEGQLRSTVLHVQAESAALQRRARATGEAARFVAPLAAYHGAPQVDSTRRRLESIEAALLDVRQLILVPHGMGGRANFYQGLDPASPLGAAFTR